MSYRLRGTTSQMLGFFAAADVDAATKAHEDLQKAGPGDTSKDEKAAKDIEDKADDENGDDEEKWLTKNKKIAIGAASLACGAISAVHGYKRHQSAGGAIGWFFLGLTGIGPIAAVAQGFGKPAEGAITSYDRYRY